MVSGTDAGRYYAAQWDAHIDSREHSSYPEEARCGTCGHCDPCPWYEVGKCAKDDEWVRFEDEPCHRWEPMEGFDELCG